MRAEVRKAKNDYILFEIENIIEIGFDKCCKICK